MKFVSFEVAKAIKDAGYPQDNVPITEIGWYNIARVYTKQLPTYWEGDNMFVAVAPTYLDVWLWLWREKQMTIDIIALSHGSCGAFGWRFGERLNSKVKFNDPEDAIISAIDDIVENHLIK